MSMPELMDAVAMEVENAAAVDVERQAPSARSIGARHGVDSDWRRK
jgi:hypothetical protein